MPTLLERIRGLLQRCPRALRTPALGLGSLAALGLLAWCADPLLAGPMRTWAERTMNTHLNGYRVRIGRARPHLWRLGLDLREVVLVQASHPEPPVADLGALEFSLQWWELLRLNVAGDLTLQHPALHIDLTQIQEESASRMSLKERGWQSAVESIFPFRLNQVRVMDGSLLYLDRGAGDKPLQATHLYLVARNVRNIDATQGALPSPVSVAGRLFDSGTVSFRGAADFLRQPYPAVLGNLEMRGVPLDRFKPLARDYQIETRGGTFGAAGTLEFAPDAHKAHFREVLLDNLQLEYLTSEATKKVEAEHAQEAVALARTVRNAPDLLLQVDHLKLSHGTLGLKDQSGRPPYRLFISRMDLAVDNLSNQGGLGRCRFQGQGAFMGHGLARINGGGRMTAVPADFDVHLQVEHAQLPDLNGLFQSHSGLTVAQGEYGLYSEFTVKDGRMEGYIKPILDRVKVYDPRTDRAKPLAKRVEMHLVQGLATLFKNHASHDTATVIQVSGPTQAPRTSEWQVLGRFLENGFLHAILPGFLQPNHPAPKKMAAPPGAAKSLS